MFFLCYWDFVFAGSSIPPVVVTSIQTALLSKDLEDLGFYSSFYRPKIQYSEKYYDDNYEHRCLIHFLFQHIFIFILSSFFRV